MLQPEKEVNIVEDGTSCERGLFGLSALYSAEHQIQWGSFTTDFCRSNHEMDTIISNNWHICTNHLFNHLIYQLGTHHQQAAGRDCSAHSSGFYRLSLAGSSMWGLAYLHCWKSRGTHWALVRPRGQNQHGQWLSQGSSDHPNAVWLLMRPKVMWTITGLTWRTRKLHSLHNKTSLTLQK